MSTVQLHYVKNHKISEQLASRAKTSFEEHGWEVLLVEGYTPANVSLGEAPHLLPLPSSRLFHEFRENSDRLLIKLAILSNHIQFWKWTAASDEPQIYAEHDVICVTDKFDLPDFEDVLILNLDAELANNHLFNTYLRLGLDPIEDGNSEVNNLPDNWPWIYTLNNKYKGSKMIPTAGCYALTPKGAAKLLKAVYDGSEQGDMNINSYNVDLKYRLPKVVDYIRRNSKTASSTLDGY